MIPLFPCQFALPLPGTLPGWVEAWIWCAWTLHPEMRGSTKGRKPYCPTLMELCWGDVEVARDAARFEMPTRAIGRGRLKMATVYRDTGPALEFGRKA